MTRGYSDINIIKKYPLLFIPAMCFRDLWGTSIFINKIGSEWETSLRSLRKYGVCLVPVTLQDDFVQSALKNIDDNLRDAEIFGSDYRLFGAEEKISRVMEEFSSNEKLYSVAHRYLRSEILLQTTLASKLTFEDGNLGSGQGWHRDSYSKQFKAMAYLTNVTMDSGPFEYLVGSHRYYSVIREIWHKRNKGKLLTNSRFTDDEVSELKKTLSLNSVKFAAPSGSVIIFDARGIHRGSPINAGSRYALTNYYLKKGHAPQRNMIGQ